MRYSMAAPPKSPGIYALKNTRTGHVYVGQTVDLQRRRMEWIGLFGNGVGRTSKEMMVLAGQTNIKDWEFRVLAEVPREQLTVYETKAISKIRAAIGEKCMNRENNEKKMRVVRAGNVALSVVTYEGKRLSHNEIAERLGVSKQAVEKKLRKRRAAGITEMTLGEYMERPK